MRVSVKAEYALRAMAELAALPGDTPVTAAQIAAAQDIPMTFLQGVLNELKRARLLHSTRGPDGGFALARPAGEITLADVYRAIDGPLINIHDVGLTGLSYPGAAEPLRQVWMAARSSLRRVLESVTIADLAAGDLPVSVQELAAEYAADSRHGR